MAEFIPFAKIARLSREVVVTEKIDGTSAQIYIGEDGEMLAASRNQYLTSRAKGGADNFGFAQWVEDNADDLRSLGPGRHYGEWWGSGILRGYGLLKGEKRFSLFNVSRWGEGRPSCCHVVPVLYEGVFDTNWIDLCLRRLQTAGSVASPGFMRPEGVVVFHPQANKLFKKTIEKDSEPKSISGI